MPRRGSGAHGVQLHPALYLVPGSGLSVVLRQRVVGATLRLPTGKKSRSDDARRWLTSGARIIRPAGRSTATCSTSGSRRAGAGDEITFLQRLKRDSFPWKEPLAPRSRHPSRCARNTWKRVRAEVEQIAGRRVLTVSRGVARRAGVSDLLHANRVEGLAAARRGVCAAGGAARAARPVSYGFGDQRAKGPSARWSRGRSALDISVYREGATSATPPSSRRSSTRSHLRNSAATTETTTWRRRPPHLPPRHRRAERMAGDRGPGVDRLARGAAAPANGRSVQRPVGGVE